METSFGEKPIRLTELCCIAIDGERLRPAAETLSRYLEPLVNRPLSVETERRSPCLYLEIAPETSGYRVAAKSPDVVITGQNLAQAVRGVYGFLSEVCGVRMFTADTVTYPASAADIAADTDISYTPPFEYTETDWFSPKNTEYALFNHITGTRYRKLPPEMGGGVDFLSGFAHTMTKEFCAAATYFNDHPDYFALRGGKRVPRQLCLTNPATRRVVTEEVLALLRRRHDPEAALQIVSVSQEDNLSFCCCPECRRAAEKYRSYAGVLLAFVNDVAQAVKDAGYDNVAVETFAYQYTRTPPTGIRPADNVIVRLCDTECCFAHPLDDAHCRPNAAFAADLKAWATLCKRLYVWDYGTNYCHFAGLFPNFDVMAANMRFFAENGVKGVYAEGNHTLKTPDTEFGELRAYLQTRLFADPTCDLARERAAFLKAYYGDGGKAVGEFLEFVCARAARGHFGIYSPMGQVLSLTDAEVKRCDAWWDEAEAAAGDKAENVRRSRLCFEYWKMQTRRGAFRNPATFRKKREALLGAINAAGVTRLRESTDRKARQISLVQAAYFKAYPVASRVLDRIYRK